MFRAAYRDGLAAGYPPDVVVMATPRTESIEDPPVGWDILRRDEARALLTRHPPACRVDLDAPPPPGHFYVVASRAAGRLKGTFVGLIPVPGPDEELPPTLSLLPPADAAGQAGPN
jgi:hypothetical protein